MTEIKKRKKKRKSSLRKTKKMLKFRLSSGSSLRSHTSSRLAMLDKTAWRAKDFTTPEVKSRLSSGLFGMERHRDGETERQREKNRVKRARMRDGEVETWREKNRVWTARMRDRLIYLERQSATIR
jgi:hypothetical protein